MVDSWDSNVATTPPPIFSPKFVMASVDVVCGINADCAGSLLLTLVSLALMVVIDPGPNPNPCSCPIPGPN